MNVACGNRWGLLDVITKLESILQCQARPQFENPRLGDVKHSQACIKKARSMIGFAPEEFEEGLRRTVDWFTAQHIPAQLQVAV